MKQRKNGSVALVEAVKQGKRNVDGTQHSGGILNSESALESGYAWVRKRREI